MDTRKRPRSGSGSLPELAGVLAAAVLCGIALLAHSQSGESAANEADAGPAKVAAGADVRPESR